MTRRGTLTPEDEALWRRANADTTPLRAQERTAKDISADPAPRESRTPTPPAPPRPPKPGGRALETASGVDPAGRAPQKAGRSEPGFDRRTAQRLRRGEQVPQARLDLHGMTKEQAHDALNGFVRRSLDRGLRYVLVITGKGGRHRSEDAPFMGGERGVLRREVPRWLRSGPYADAIIGLFEAHIRHGGAGALYVCLKKRR